MATYFVAVTGSQVAESIDDQRIRREWFAAERDGMLPLKIASADAMQAHVHVVEPNQAVVISVTLSLSYFHTLVQTGIMVPCLHVGGYRLYTDLQFDGECVVFAEVSEVLQAEQSLECAASRVGYCR